MNTCHHLSKILPFMWLATAVKVILNRSCCSESMIKSVYFKKPQKINPVQKFFIRKTLNQLFCRTPVNGCSFLNYFPWLPIWWFAQPSAWFKWRKKMKQKIIYSDTLGDSLNLGEKSLGKFIVSTNQSITWRESMR